MADPALPIFRTVDAFLIWENQEPQHYEIVGGVLALMVGGTENHDLIGNNIATILNQRLRGTPCRVHGINLKVRSPAPPIMYPDAFVRCGPASGERTVVSGPVLVVEVLSPTTQQADLTRKCWAYQAIDTLQAMLFVAADEARVKLFSRDPDGVWLSRFIVGPDAEVPLDAFSVALPMAELYAGADMGAIAA